MYSGFISVQLLDILVVELKTALILKQFNKSKQLVNYI